MSDERNYDSMEQSPSENRMVARGDAREERLDERLRAVEGKLIRVETQVCQAREDIKEGFLALNATGRLDTCPHNSDFVAILGSLEAGGKRFDQLEAELEDAIVDRKKITDNHETRIHDLEESWKTAATSVKTAKWVVGSIGLAAGWALSELVPFLKKLWEVS